MEKSNRPQRNRRHSRRAWPPEDDLRTSRAVKRLFTPEIKRMLKEWLIRRRDNPYPSREEKKRLAIETGLTYTQICNWFANWRRKLKNSERAKKSWGHLIKNYNNNAKGNVEQFSISSEDSIWEEEESKNDVINMNMNLNEKNSDDDDEDDEEEDSSSGSFLEQNSASAGSLNSLYCQRSYQPNFYVENFERSAHKYENDNLHQYEDYKRKSQSQNYSMNEALEKPATKPNFNSNCNDYNFGNNKRKYKHKMMEKYLRDTTSEQSEYNVDANSAGALVGVNETSSMNTEGKTLSKWLESAANFTPNKNSYYIDWNQSRSRSDKKGQQTQPTLTMKSPTKDLYFMQNKNSHLTDTQGYESIHHKDELDAAEALANLAFNCRQRMIEKSIYSKMNTITS